MAILLSCRGLTKAYDAHPLFEDLAFGIDAGSRTGIIGPNGSGKSTLVRILAGLEIPDSGEVALASGTRLVYLPQRDEFEPGATPLSVLLAVVSPDAEEHEREHRARRTLTDAGFGQGGNAGILQPVEQLSGGWRKRLAILRAVAREPDLLLADEPTNHLDLEGIWWLERLVAEARFTVALVSHDRFFLERVCDRVIEVNKLYPGGMFQSQGGYASFLEKRAEFVANQRKQQDVLDNVMRREVAWLRMNPAAQMRKSKARIDRAGELGDQLNSLKWRNNQNRTVDIDFTATGRRTNDLVVVDGVAKKLGGKALFADVELTLSPGMRLGLMGLNGSGKTSFLKVVCGQLQPDAGKVKLASNLKVVYFDQRREALDPHIPLRKALCHSGDTVIYRGRGMHIAAWAKRFLFSPAQLDLEVGKLSGGEQARVLIADLMRKDADLLVLDEPTNDLDIPSLEVLEQSLLDFPGAVMLVTHDRWLLERVSTQLLALDGQGGAFRVADTAQWEDLAARMAAARTPAEAAPAAAKAAPAKSSGPGLSKPERRELERMEDKITAADAAIAAAEAEVNAAGSDMVRLEKACAALAAAQAESERLYARWADLESRA
ncbi:MAG: ABC-F family ATP-binding cassette domain-containing protein [Planctomycetes bacterium]|nr:ABC-F family ATP-binding cassette domain-containing protein [Planctomycetota bacterium]